MSIATRKCHWHICYSKKLTLELESSGEEFLCLNKFEIPAFTKKLSLLSFIMNQNPLRGSQVLVKRNRQQEINYGKWRKGSNRMLRIFSNSLTHYQPRKRSSQDSYQNYLWINWVCGGRHTDKTPSPPPDQALRTCSTQFNIWSISRKIT